jgi:hypothetical protein
MKKSVYKKEPRVISVWLDHTAAWLYRDGSEGEAEIIASGVESRVRIPGESADGTRLGNFRSTNNESHKHHREQNQLRAFYKDISAALLPYDEIHVAGAGTAGRELFNFISADSRFREKRLFQHTGAKEMPKNLKR